MAVALTEEQQLAYMSHIDADLLKTALGVDTLPKGILGIYRVDVVDWDNDDVSWMYIVFEDEVDLNKSETMPKFDFKKVRNYFFDTILDRFPMINFINVKNLPKLPRYH
jgi:hypothetical protein